MQYQVPQFIDIEDRIVGPFSLRQFMYIGGAGVFIFIFYFTLETWVTVILSLIFGTAGLALALVKVNGQQLPKIVVAAFRYLWRPQTYVWQPAEKVHLQKTPETIKQSVQGIDVEQLVAGLSLRRAWTTVQTGSHAKAPPEPKPEKPADEHYRIFARPTGDRRAARQIDYR